MSRTTLSLVMVLASSSSLVLAQPAKPIAKAARVPPAPKLADHVKPQLKSDAEATVGESGRTPAPAPPASDVTRLAKTLSGTYACTGTIANLDGGMRKTAARMKVASDLDGYWLAFDIAEKSSAEAPYPTRIHMERTYCNDARTWTSVMMDNAGGVAVMTAEHADAADVTWHGATHRNGGKVSVRAHDERDDKAGTFRLWGELSADGKTFAKQYDLTCAK